ncbi:hypothetical protein E4T66_17445 [Sinimarinibacterium sp. CAU 1509]|uniref:hypothetical protein n=1 Tax=Sinimarinibacterium sp. CAU 1509 TaxID=2562283 RepID=UPI0010AC87B5|nr:hypothetical protein [Sinimarinibacterium sp. CAU 1509]TJY57194.1 hypothetical protein E4T66_17445 [Sinimarinibacterium sp. CAU 1509]
MDSDLERACWIHVSFLVTRYLLANSHGRWDGAEKALRHRELCQFYAALPCGADPDAVSVLSPEYRALHSATQALTDNLDTEIGFPLDSRPDFDRLAPLFFAKFHALALAVLG